MTADSDLIPLVRPSFPAVSTFSDRWEAATKKTGVFSNFGELWHSAQLRLSELTGRFAIPVSTGTHAVTLAIAAAEATFGEAATVAFEAFTFQATALAARRIDPGAAKARTGFDNEALQRDIVVRTIPFGMRRYIEKKKNEGVLVIDAAGAFHPDAIKQYPAEAYVAVSFHATKNFPIGEGGCVFLPRGASYAARTIMAAMNFGFDDRRNVLPGYATNAKLDELRCALLLAQLDRAEHFAARSARIRETVKAVCAASGGTAWAPYELGVAQSLAVVAHRDPAQLVETLFENGFVARRVFHPHLSEHLLTYDEQRLVAIPSDCTDVEIEQMARVIGGVK